MYLAKTFLMLPGLSLIVFVLALVFCYLVYIPIDSLFKSSSAPVLLRDYVILVIFSMLTIRINHLPIYALRRLFRNVVDEPAVLNISKTIASGFSLITRPTFFFAASIITVTLNGIRLSGDTLFLAEFQKYTDLANYVLVSVLALDKVVDCFIKEGKGFVENWKTKI